MLKPASPETVNMDTEVGDDENKFVSEVVREAREYQKDPTAAIIKVRSDPKINDGLLGAIQLALEEQEIRRLERQEEEDKFHEAMNDAHENSREQRRREEAERKFDEEIHTIGGKQMSGADIHKTNLFILDPNNADAIEEQLMNEHGISREEAKLRRQNLEEMSKLLEKKRKGQQLSEEEQRRLKELKDGQTGQDYNRVQERSVELEGKLYNSKVSAEQTGQYDTESKTSASKGADIAQEICGGDGTCDIGPVIAAPPLKPAYDMAKSATVPLDNPELNKKSAAAPAIVVAKVQPQAEGATF